jgi:hypothetical protein
VTAQLALFRDALTPATVLRHARQLARLVPQRQALVRTDGVVPITRDDALAWTRAESLELLSDEGMVFKLAVRGPSGAIEAVCFGSRPLSGERHALELTPVAPLANEAAFQAALRAGALAAQAMGFGRIVYYRPVGDDPGHPYDGFAPLDPRPFRAQRGGGLAWKRDALDTFTPWLRAAWPERYRALKADELVRRQTEAILAWEDAEQELLERTDYAPTDAQYARLAAKLGFDWDSWRPGEMTREDALQFLDQDALFERYAIAGAPRKPGTLFVEALPFGMARDVVVAWHSHLRRASALRTHLFSLGVYAHAVPGVYPEHLRAVAIVTLPVSQALMLQGAVVEVVRVAVGSELPPLAGVDPKHRSSEASFVLAAVERTALALGYDRVVSSTLLGEAGAGYRAAGWKPVAVGLGGEWGSEARPREEAEQPGIKVRWETGPGAASPVAHPEAGTVDALVRVAAKLHGDGLLPLGGMAARGAKANDPEAAFRAMFREEQARFAAVYGPRSLAATAALVLIDAPCPGTAGPCGGRNIAQATWAQQGRGARAERRHGTVEFARRALALPWASLVACVRHELGHLADDRVNDPGSEVRADRIAERVGGQPMYYDRMHLQTVDSSAPGAHRGRPRHLHQ